MEINIKGSYFSGLLKFNKRLPIANPAKLIKHRFTEEQIGKLLEIKWWDWSDERIKKNLSLLCQPNIDKFINYHS